MCEQASKRFKIDGEADMNGDNMEFFKGIGKIPYKPDAGPTETMVYKHYNATEMVHGKSMEDWLRFSVCYWHTFRGVGLDPFGTGTITRPWEDGTDSVENAKNRLRVAFEFMSKLGVKYWTFHDRDISPEGANLEETNKNLDEITDFALELQKQTGIKLLWATCNLFTNPRYMNGAGTNPDAHVVAYAGAQVKKGLEVALKLGAENFVFWGGREGYQSLLNTKVYSELSHMANFFKMALSYAEKIGFTGQFLIEPKAKEPTKHQYDYDAMTVVSFLKSFDLDKHFKINVEPNHTTLAGHCFEHDIIFASEMGFLGSIDSNTGSPDLGWDTDQFPMDVKNCTMVMRAVIKQGGIQPGGLNFDAKVRRESTAIEDMFIAHIGAMDTLARALRAAAKIEEEGVMDKERDARYESFTRDIGAKIEKGAATLEECEAYVMKNGEPTLQSAKQEHFEGMLNYYV